MSLIKQTQDLGRVSEVEYPAIPGFFISLKYVSREELTKIRNATLKYTYSKKTHQREEEIDSDKFLKAYSERVVVGWRGLKVKHLPSLYPANIAKENPNSEVKYSTEDAYELLAVSTEFDAFITDAMGDVSTFEEQAKEIEEKN